MVASSTQHPWRSGHACARRPVLASSPEGRYDTSPAGDGASGVDTDGEVAAVGRVLAAAERVVALDLEMLTDEQLEAHLSRLRRPLAMLEAARARALSAAERRVRRAAGPDRVTGEVLESRRRAAKDQRMSPSETKRAVEAGRHADNHPTTGDAFADGQLSATHVRLLGEALDRLPANLRPDAERALLELARTCDPVAFGRQVRNYLADHAPAQLHEQQRDQHRQRRFRMTDTEDGGVAFSGLAHGTAAETIRTAVHAFRRPDTPDEHRTPEQRAADAFEQLCDAALRIGEAPTIHGVRPHLLLIVEETELARDNGVARLAGSQQPITLNEAGHLLTDCAVSRVTRTADNTPIEVTRVVRTVPKGLWRALLVRDGGCRWPGCDAPASWCDVAHAQHPYRAEGFLSPDNAVLLCRRHHRRYDNGPWQLHINGDHITFQHTTNTDALEPNRLPHPTAPEDQAHLPLDSGPPDPERSHDHENPGNSSPDPNNDGPPDEPTSGTSPPDEPTSGTSPPDEPTSGTSPPGDGRCATSPPGEASPAVRPTPSPVAQQRAVRGA